MTAVVGLISLEDSFGGMLKDALGAGVMNELSARDQAFGHHNLAPGAQSIGRIGGVHGVNWFGDGRIRHGRHSR